MSRRKKRPFLLLEFLISFALLSLCLTPLLLSQVSLYQEEKKRVIAYRLGKEVDLVYVLLYETFFENPNMIHLALDKKGCEIALPLTVTIPRVRKKQAEVACRACRCKLYPSLKTKKKTRVLTAEFYFDFPHEIFGPYYRYLYLEEANAKKT